MIILFLLGFILILSLLMAWPFMWGWNFAIAPTITVCDPITDYWVAFVFMVMISAFFTGSNSSGSSKD